MNAPQTRFLKVDWPSQPVTQVPYQLFSDPRIFDLEQERIFRGPTWNYLALECELPNPGDFVSTFVGDTPVVVTRDRDGEVHAWVNRCAHRGAQVCRELRGNTDLHTCVYHQWAFDPAGKLVGVPFRKGLQGKGGYPQDFDMTEHGLDTLRVETLHGVIFGTFDPAVGPLTEYLGEVMVANLERCLAGRELEVLGYSHQQAQCNWKLYAENTRDSYHAILLHLFYPTFGIARPAQKMHTRMNDKRFHNLFMVWKPAGDENLRDYQQNTTRAIQGGQQVLEAPEILAFMNERGDDIAITIESLFPNCVFQHIQNGLAMRQIRPQAADRFELVWTYFGYKDDSPELRQHRLRQANMLGPAGLIAMEDAEAGELIQRAIVRDGAKSSFIEMGGTGAEDLDYGNVDENSIRGFWQGYRELMQI